jgi:hypothetical protein
MATVSPSSGTTLYFYTNVINTRQTASTVTAGALILNTAQATPNQKAFFIGASLFGVYYRGQFYPAGQSPSIPPNQNFYLIYQTTSVNYSSGNAPMFFIGFAAFTNQAKDGSYYSGEILLDGLWVRSTC